VAGFESGESITLGSSTIGTQLRALKASPILIGISCGLDKKGDLVMRMAASVSGSVVLSDESEPINYFQPVAIFQGDPKQGQFSSLFWWGGEIDEQYDTSTDDMTRRLQSLEFLIED
jgi:hypothetical protein